MSIVLYTNLLTKLKNARPARRLTMAQENGYPDVATYQQFLETRLAEYNEPAAEQATCPSPTAKLPTIHVIDVVDDSSSMRAENKHIAASDGIRKAFLHLTKEKEVDYTYSAYTFDVNARVLCKNLPLSDVDTEKFRFIAQGRATALHDCLASIVKEINPADFTKTLINVYTDGQDNFSRLSAIAFNQIIKKATESGIVITFVATINDAEFMKKRYDIHDSNILAYDNTGAGMEKAMIETISAREVFTEKVLKGEDVTTGFYKKVVH